MESKFLCVMTAQLVKEMLGILFGGMDSAPAPAQTKPEPPQAEAPSPPPVQSQPAPPPQAPPPAYSEPPQAPPPAYSAPPQAPPPPVYSAPPQPPPSRVISATGDFSQARPVQLQSFDDEMVFANAEVPENLELLRSVPLDVTVEIGKTVRKVKEILEFTQGTVLELDKQAGAQVDIIVNGQPIAKGDVVVIGDNFGVRITEILRRQDLLNL
jgi:flagellar motor switch protein FliN/FliY